METQSVEVLEVCLDFPPVKKVMLWLNLWVSVWLVRFVRWASCTLPCLSQIVSVVAFVFVVLKDWSIVYDVPSQFFHGLICSK